MVMLFIPESVNTFEEKVHQLNQVRQVRSCVEGNLADGDVEGHPLLDSYLPFTFIVQIGIIAAGILLILLFLGLIKGILGLFIHPPIGMLGLGYLVDLPRTLNKYQENELAQMRVVFDTVGWPIHPQTGKRTVRAITKRMEFCSNVVFFIAFPLVIIISILSACFTHKTYDEDDGGECYYKVNTIMLSDTPSLKVLAKGCTTKGAGGKYNTGDKSCPTKGKGGSGTSSAGCDKTCKNMSKSSSIPTNSKSKSSSSGTGGKSALKSSKSSLKSDDSAKSKKSKSKSAASKKSPSKSKSGTKSNKSKNSKSKASTKSNSKTKGSKAKKNPKKTYKDEDSTEDADTQYVLDQMRESEISLKNK